MSLSRLDEDGIPMTCLEVGSLARWSQNSVKGNRPNSRNMLNIAFSDSPGATVYQDYYRGHYRKKKWAHI
jgi:hypothetical protein